jgi:hypothetical protein
MIGNTLRRSTRKWMAIGMFWCEKINLSNLFKFFRNSDPKNLETCNGIRDPDSETNLNPDPNS